MGKPAGIQYSVCAESRVCFLVQFAAQNPAAPAQYLNGTLITTINPRTNNTWANITEWFEYDWNIANSFNTYGGYSNITANMNLATQAERYYPVRVFIDYNAPAGMERNSAVGI